MRFRGRHLLLFVFMLVAAIFVYATFHRPPDHNTGAILPGAAEDAFLQQVERLQAVTPASTSSVGALPPVDTDPGLIPVIDVVSPEFDAGTVPNDKVTNVKLPIYNRGKAPLRLTDVRTTCACTFPTIPPGGETIAPGSDGFVEIMISPFRIPGFHSRKTITIYSTDPATPSISVAVSANVDPEFDLIPEVLDFGSVTKGDAAVATMLVRQRTSLPFEVTGAREPGSESAEDTTGDITFVVEKRPEAEWASAGKAEYLITATLSPILSPGSFERRFSLATTLARLPQMWCMAKGVITGFYKVDPTFPDRLMLRAGGLSDRPDIQGGTVVITTERPVEILDIRSDNPAFAATVRLGDDPGVVYLDVEAVPGTPPGRIDGDIRFTVKSNDTALPERVGIGAYLRAEMKPAASAG